MHARTSQCFTIDRSTATIGLTESPAGVLGLEFSWSPAPPASMDKWQKVEFSGKVALALEKLLPEGFDQVDDDDPDEDINTKFERIDDARGLTKRAVPSMPDTSLGLIKAVHASGGKPLNVTAGQPSNQLKLIGLPDDVKASPSALAAERERVRENLDPRDKAELRDMDRRRDLADDIKALHAAGIAARAAAGGRK